MSHTQDKTKRYGPWMQTHSGRQFWPLDPRSEDFFLPDIAHALGMKCRFNGHCKYFYSVAAHSLMVADILAAQGHGPEICLAGLMHDMSEAYLPDVVSPLKPLLRFLFPYGAIDFKVVEEAILMAACNEFGFEYPLPPEVKQADLIALATEKRDLMLEPPRPWLDLPEPWDTPGGCALYTGHTSDISFSHRFKSLQAAIREAA